MDTISASRAHARVRNPRQNVFNQASTTFPLSQIDVFESLALPPDLATCDFSYLSEKAISETRKTTEFATKFTKLLIWCSCIEGCLDQKHILFITKSHKKYQI